MIQNHMPPFSQKPSSPQFGPPKPLGPRFDFPQQNGMDQQTKNTIMFAVIFSVFAAAILLFIFLKPEKKPQGNEAVVATSTSAEATSTEAGASWGSSFFKLFSFSLPKQTPRTSITPVLSKPSTTTQNSGGANTTNSPSNTNPVAATTTDNVPTKQLIGVYSELSSAQAQLDLQFYQMDLPSSPVRGKIWISSVHRSTDSQKEYLILSTSKDLPTGTDITGMTIKSVVTGAIVQIGKGVGLPLLNVVNSPTNVYIASGQKIYINTGSSPLGYSFKTNLCAGYFEQFQNFTPALTQSCPLLKTESRPAPPNQLQDACLDYIDRVPKCTIITALPKSTAEALNQEQQYRCLTFIQNKTGYQNCFSIHRNDASFSGTEWRLFLSRTQPLWKSKREVIWLLDQQGNFVSQYSY